MNQIYKLALGPLLLLQARHARAVALRLAEPVGPRAGLIWRDSSDRALRLLFVGDSSAAGVGVDHQRDALAPRTASLLADRMGRSVRWQLLAKSGVNTRETIDLVTGTQLEPADIIITALGVNDVTAQRSPRQFVADYQQLIDQLMLRVGAAAVIVNGVAPMHVALALPQPLRWYLGRCARSLDLRLQRWIASSSHLSYVCMQWAAQPLELACDGYHPGSNQYGEWAKLLAVRASQLLRTI